MKVLHLISAAALLAAGVACAASGAESLKVELQDPSTDESIEHMRIVLDRQTLKSGRVTIRAENRSKRLVHEVVIARDADAEDLPLNENRDLVLASEVRMVGAITNLTPGESGTLTLVLSPGRYALYCNLPGHYLDGMAVTLRVVP